MTRTFTFELDEIDQVANEVLRLLKSRIVLFNGEMGTGKTTFIKRLLKQMGSIDTVSSPTFSLVNEYQTSNESVYHFDLYRIKDTSEVLDIGFEDYVFSNQWLFIEWPEQVMDLLPENVNVIQITINNNKSRSLKLTVNTKKLTENYAMDRH